MNELSWGNKGETIFRREKKEKEDQELRKRNRTAEEHGETER
jgi:hypothetical protein